MAEWFSGIDVSKRIHEAVHAVALEWERVKDNGKPYTRQLASIGQVDLLAHLEISAEGAYDVVNKRASQWFKGCHLKQMFPDVKRPFDSFVRSVVDQLKLGESEKKIALNLGSRLSSTASAA